MDMSLLCVICSGSLHNNDGFVTALKQSPTRYPFDAVFVIEFID